MLDELGRLVHLEVDPEHRDPQRQPSEVVVARPVLASLRVDRLDRAPVGRDSPRDLLGGGVQPDHRLEAVRRPGDALLHVGGRVFGRQLARREADTGRGGSLYAVDAEGAPVVAGTVPGDEVPPAAVVDERVWLDLASAAHAIAAPGGEAEALGVAAGAGYHGQGLRGG